VRHLVWSQDALDEVDAIGAYIARNNPVAAVSAVDRIDRAARNLAGMPTGGRGRVAGTYEKVMPGLPYIIAYALETAPGGDEVLAVLRVIHGARNWPAGAWPDD
jgi:toxin ParE1/3/4